MPERPPNVQLGGPFCVILESAQNLCERGVALIYTVTFNPAVDYVMHPLTLDMGFTNRSSSEEVRCGGNGINDPRAELKFEL